MLKNKNFRVSLIAVVIFCMMAMYGFIPTVEAASLSDASDRISDSDISATNVTHTFSFTNAIALEENDYIEVTFPAGFTNILLGGISCPAGTTPVDPSGGQIVRCDVGAGGLAAEAHTDALIVSGVTNPGTNNPVGYTISISTKDSGDAEIEGVDVKVYIIEDVSVTAHVDATLTFTIAGLAADVSVNGVSTTEESLATSTPFGTLTDTASSTVGQQLSVTTNATDGFTVTVFQDHNLESAGSADIDAFKNGVVPGTPEVWSGPTAVIDQPDTYGHLGLTSADATLAAGDTFGDAKYTGFDGSTPVPVMYHNGPVNGTGEGVTQVAYTAQISSMQEAGDYTSTLTYVCTPQY